MAPAIVRQLNDTLNAVLQAADLREKLSVEAIEPMPMASDAFGRFVQQDIERWTRLARERNIQLDS
jgi:tripartite-type tricarboxylate transporter receptor subunit TctC